MGRLSVCDETWLSSDLMSRLTTNGPSWPNGTLTVKVTGDEYWFEVCSIRLHFGTKLLFMSIKCGGAHGVKDDRLRFDASRR